MQFSGEAHINAPREEVWSFISDPEQIAQCAPGLQSVEVVDDEHFDVSVRAGIGMIRGNFNFKCEWVEREAPDHARIKANGTAPGSAVTMDSTMDLQDSDEGGTTLIWSADAQVSGRLAGVGARLINPVANRMTQQIFDCIREKLHTKS